LGPAGPLASGFCVGTAPPLFIEVRRNCAARSQPLDITRASSHVRVMTEFSYPDPKGPAFAAMEPERCATMAEVRAGVDEIDRLLVQIVARRQRYMDAAARIKPTRAVVRDEARIQQVLDNVHVAAEQAGLSWAIAEPVWRTMIERCIAHELEVWDRTRA
jgi:isochorismate pyruvate lyase